MKILTIVGARPQFIKASVVSAAIQQKGMSEVIVHTGQHFDSNMSDIFFGQLGIPEPQYNLNISGGSHGAMTGAMLTEIERVMLMEKPDQVLVYGDTNSTLAGALAASKLHISLAHVEAGLRSYNMKMPEEINRILTDQLSNILLCPTSQAIENLRSEGFDNKNVQIHQVGDVMQDSALFYAERSTKPESVSIEERFILATIHRAENTDDPDRLKSIIDALNQLHTFIPVIMPLHPRTEAAIKALDLVLNVEVIPPQGYLEMLWLLDHCGIVVTDSGGVQKEAFFFNKPCVTARDQTEWVELIDTDANVLVGADGNKLINEVKARYSQRVNDANELYGGGKASQRIAQLLLESNV